MNQRCDELQLLNFIDRYIYIVEYITIMVKEGEKAPTFKCLDDKGKERTLQEFKDRILVLFFYPKDETAICTKEACTFRDRYEDFVKEGADVIGVSEDNQDSHQRFSSKHRLPFTLLTDQDGQLAKSYGVEKEAFIFKGRTTFIIGPEGKIACKYSSQLNYNAHVETALEY
ncbi:AhpC/TSA family protein [Cavenderia fasciculata]|uniref:thioredoxin-dependent peroxiredoxin n=1 Tax=Cavenderia fasciculata TaxID=261658 RepID=F4PVR4_CACFS|nr:AhpC/TSA family protein [Cavenderia fasciculata]EGG20078.1 AhpC/TSA family protein [Cavenderia fasciculata]|eukprot:XP_004367061.1 AhpC/TSA family protein [Cavenderia fasciculata]